MAMELALVGAEVLLLSPVDHPARLTRAGSQWLRYSAFRPMDTLRYAIEKHAPDLVIPCDERVVRHLHRLHAITPSRQVRRTIEQSLGAAVSFPVTITTHALLSLAHREGVRATDSMSLASIDGLQVWGANHPFPWVLKADGSSPGFSARIVHSPRQAETAYREMTKPVGLRLAAREALEERDMFWFAPWLRRARPGISLQSHIDGRPANCAVACWQGEVLAGISSESVASEMRTALSTIARIIDNPEMLDAARRVVRALGCSGLISFDFMIEAATGAAYMTGMNPRATPMCTVRLGAGRDLVEALIARAAGRPVSHRPPITERDMIVFFPHTWRVDPDSAHLRTGYHDVPWEEPALVRALMRPKTQERHWLTRALHPVWRSHN
jgi:hypothetical protein